MKHDFTKMSKKQLKDYVNSKGFFTSAIIQRNAAVPVAFKNAIPEGAIYFKAIASNGELNRNGYIIRESAWKGAIAGYMENPVILLQHDMNQPIGRGLSAKVTKDGLIIEGFIFDEHTNGRFGQGLFNAISTGHITEAVEFQNEATGQVLDEETFRALPWEEKMNDNWVMAVTALDWLENSAVSIGANRKSLILAKDLVRNYVEAWENEPQIAKPAVSAVADDDETEDDIEESVEREEEEKENEEKNTETEEALKDVKEDVEEEAEAEAEEVPSVEPEENNEKPDDTVAGETDVVETPVAPDGGSETNAVKTGEPDTVVLSKADIDEFNGIVRNLVDQLAVEKKKNATLTAALESIPRFKGVVMAHANGNANHSPKKSSLGVIGNALVASGVKINS